MKQRSASDIKFCEYTRWISEQFLEKYGRSYETQDTVRNQWRHTHEYSIDAEKFLINRTLDFINNLSTRDPNSTNLSFLSALTGLMADYLSLYTMRKYGTPQSKKVSNTWRKNAEKELKNILFYDSKHIKYLKTQQTAKQQAKAAGKKMRNQYNKNKQTKQSQQDYDLVCQIRAVRIEYVTTWRNKKY